VLTHAGKPSAIVVVPVPAGETLKPKTLGSILDQSGSSVEQLVDLL